MGGESGYDKGCGTGNGNRKSGGYGGGDVYKRQL